MDSSPHITRLLREVRGGNPAVEADLLQAIYPELRRIAIRCLRPERADHTLQPTALVHEAYLQLVDQMDRDWQNRAHFFAVSAQLMRRILVDYARQHRAQKRGGGQHKVELGETILISHERLEEVLTVDLALHKLALLDERQSKIVELRFFGGLTEEEVANLLQVSARTVKRDWTIARAWLYGELIESAKE